MARLISHGTAWLKWGLTLTLACALPSLSAAETFQEALVSAYNNNPTLKAERARLRETDESYIQARAQGRVSSALVGSIAQNYARFPVPLPTGGTSTQSVWENPAAAQVQIIQPLYQGGRVRALKTQASSGIMAAREALRLAEQNVMMDVANAYVSVRRDEERAQIRRNNVRVLARQELAARERFDVGEGTLTDISQAEARLAASQIGLAQADASLAVSRAAYERAVGHPPVDLSDTPDVMLPANLNTAQDLALANNPQIMAVKYQVMAAESAIGVAKSAGRPSVSLNANIGGIRNQLSTISRADSAEVTAQLRVPLYAGGANKSRVRQAKQAHIRAGFEAQALDLRIEEAVAQLWAQLEAAKLSLTSAEVQAKAAEVAFEGVQLEQQVGTRNTLDVLNAEQEVLNAKLSIIETEHSVDVTTYQLLAVLGAFDAKSLQLPISLHDPAKNLDLRKQDGLSKFSDKFMPEMLK
ncbi:MAG: TolC family outer membrane protein [Maricaulaceae bacterium]